MEQTDKLAVLIDADNAQPSIVDGLLSEIANYGLASVKRIYGDWTTPGLKGWKEVLLQHSIQPIQQFAYTTGKNATDSAMIIDAMDLLYSDNFNGFCIVSSDSDFTKLASRIRESGLLVYGFGEVTSSIGVALGGFAKTLGLAKKKIITIVDQYLKATENYADRVNTLKTLPAENRENLIRIHREMRQEIEKLRIKGDGL